MSAATAPVAACRILQRTIHAGDNGKLGVGNHRSQSAGPCLVGWIADIAVRDLARDDARPGPLPGRQPSGNAKADDGFGAVRNLLADELVEPTAVATTRDGPDPRDSGGYARFRAKTSRGEDEARALRLPAHIPTRTDVVLEAFRLR
jgi:hypothetical protein